MLFQPAVKLDAGAKLGAKQSTALHKTLGRVTGIFFSWCTGEPELGVCGFTIAFVTLSSMGCTIYVQMQAL